MKCSKTDKDCAGTGNTRRCFPQSQFWEKIFSLESKFDWAENRASYSAINFSFPGAATPVAALPQPPDPVLQRAPSLPSVQNAVPGSPHQVRRILPTVLIRHRLLDRRLVKLQPAFLDKVATMEERAISNEWIKAFRILQSMFIARLNQERIWAMP